MTPTQQPSPGGRVQPYQGSYLTPSFEHATVLDAMHPGILTCTPDASLVEVARVMATHHVHCVAVLGIDVHDNVQQLVWGIVSDLDLVRAATDGDETRTAGEIAATEPVTIDAGDPLAMAAQAMQEHDVHHLVVTSGRDPRPIGVLSCLDLAGVVAWGRG